MALYGHVYSHEAGYNRKVTIKYNNNINNIIIIIIIIRYMFKKNRTKNISKHEIKC